MAGEWYELVSGPSLEQGDIIADCPIYSPIYPSEPNTTVTDVESFTYDIVVMSQSCDLVQDREKLTHAVLCPLRERSEIASDPEHPLAKKGMLANAAKNKEPAFFVLERQEDGPVKRELSAVHFRQVYTLPVVYLRTFAEKQGARLRLKSPYREALASRFASFFARVALPNDPQV